MKTQVLKTYLLLLFILTTLSSVGQIINFPDPVFKQALLDYTPVIDTNNDGEITVQEAALLTTLNISGYEKQYRYNPSTGTQFLAEGIYDFTGIENFTNLTSLICTGNDLTSLDVSALTQLTYLDCSNNINTLGFSGGITNLILPSSTTLTGINFSYNHITSLDLSSQINLTNINGNINNLTSIILPTNSNLDYLSLINNNLTTLNLTNQNQLTTVDARYNQLSSFDITPLNNLIYLSLVDNNISNFITYSVPNNTLVHLSLVSNSVNNLDLSSFQALKHLNISNNQISTLILPATNSLEELNCWNNNLSTLDESKLVNANSIAASGNQLTSINLSASPNLNYIDFSNNNLSSLNLKNGNNSLITSNRFEIRNNANLQLVCVDDISYANTTFTYKDTQSYFASICSFIPTNSNTITGTVSFDFDANGCDPLDKKSINTKLTYTSTNTSNVTFTDNDGQYLLYTQEANNTLDIFTNLPSFFSVSPTTQNVNFAGSGATQVVDFCITANAAVNDVKVSVLPITESRPGFETTVRVFYENVGSTVLSGDINLTFDDLKEVFISASETTVSQTINSLTWNYTNLQPFAKSFIDVTFQINTPTDPVNPVNNGDVLPYNCTINPVIGDANPGDNTDNNDVITLGSYDPNDIIALEGNYIKDTQVSDFLNYRIRFQNTGTASAINVVVKNELDSDLDWDSFQPITASHDYRISITDDNKVDFIFENIHLADSTSNEPASHGWIYYKIKPKSTFAIGDVIENTANIYFDFNFPVTTNTFTTQIEEPIAPPIPNLKAKVFPNPTRKYANIKVNLKGKLVLYNKYGVKVFKHRLKKGVNKFNFGWLRSGRYYLKIKSKNQVIYKNLIKKKNRRGQNHH